MWALTISLSPSPKGDVGGKLMHLDIKYLICHQDLTATAKWFKPELTFPELHRTQGGALARGDGIRSGTRSKERHLGTNHTNDVTQIWGEAWSRILRAVPTPECVPESHGPHPLARSTVGSRISTASATHACDTHNRASFSRHGGWFLSHLQNEG